MQKGKFIMSTVPVTGTARGTATVHGDADVLSIKIPSDPHLLEALGRLVIARTHLELALRYTIKVLAGLSVRDAMDATSEARMPQLRNRVRSLFKEKKPIEQEKAQLDALLLRGKRLLVKCNTYLHAAYAITASGKAVIQTETYSWGPAPSTDEVNMVTGELQALGNDIHEARLIGFISDVNRRSLERPSAENNQGDA
jgi:hypothetical protein